MQAAKQLITAIAREVVPKVRTKASPGTSQDLGPTTSVDREAARTKRVPTPSFQVTDE
jgi:histidine ammonia-lyase